MALAVTEATFDDVVVKSSKPVLVDFWAEWCGPCRMIGPIVEQIGQEYEGKAVVVKCDVDENPEIATRFAVRNIPTLLFIKNGEVADKLVGAVQKSKIIEKLDALM